MTDLARISIHGTLGHLRPGQSLTVGRHAANDLVLAHGGIAPFHLHLSWERDASQPAVVCIAGACAVDGVSLAPGAARPLDHGARLEVGGLRGEVALGDPAELWRTSLTALGQQGMEVVGWLDDEPGWDALLGLVAERRASAVLELLDVDGGPAGIRVHDGRLDRAWFGPHRGELALQRLAGRTRAGRFRLSPTGRDHASGQGEGPPLYGRQAGAVPRRAACEQRERAG